MAKFDPFYLQWSIYLWFQSNNSYENILFFKKDRFNILLTAILILYMSLTYLIFILPISLDQNYNCMIILSLISFFFPFQQLYLIISKDPGVIPRSNLEDPEKSSENLTEASINRLEKNEEIVTERESKILIEPAGQPISRFLKPRYCTTCQIIRPPRSSHCRYCDHCVQGFDHHCFWVGSCIGIRNWRNFVYFISACLVATFFASINCLIIISTKWQALNFIIDHFTDNKQSFHIFLYVTIIIFCSCVCRCHYSVSISILFLFVCVAIWHSYQILPYVKEMNLQNHYYDNPFIVISVSIQYFVGFFAVLPVTVTNWRNVSQFKTTKEIDAEYRINYKYNYVWNLKANCDNLKKFVSYKIPESLIGY